MNKMKIFTLIFTLVALFIFTRCNEENFQFVVPVPIEADFDVNDNDGAWNESYVVEYLDFADALDDFEDAILAGIYLEGVTLHIEDQAATLTGVENVTLQIVDGQGVPTDIYTNLSISIPAGGAAADVVVSDLVEAGVTKVTSLIESYLDGTNTANFTLVSTGTSVPSGTPLDMTLTVEIKLTADVEQALEVPFFVGKK